MGYRTYVSIRVVEFDTTKENHSNTRQEAFEKIINLAEPCNLVQHEDESSFEDNNGHTIDAITEVSKSEPGLLMEAYIDGTSEDSNDQRTIRIRNGETEEYSCKVIFEPFEFLVTDKEKKNISDIKARCFGRLDLLDVAKAIADGFPEADANELSELMAGAARDYLTEKSKR